MTCREKELLNEAFESNWIAPLGPFVNQFENDMSDYVGVEHACALSSGTAGLHLALKSLGVGEGDQVLCPSLTFVATANAIHYVGAEPIFIDVDLNDWVIDVSIIEKAIKKYKPKAIIAVDLYGQSCDYNRIQELCTHYNISLLEDAAEGLGSEYNGRKLGSFGDIGIFSFNGNKIITTSGGGMVLSNNFKLIKKCRYLATQAREPVLHYEHNEVGFNYRMSNLLAALGKGQLGNLDIFVSKRRKIFRNYMRAFKHIEGMTFLKESRSTISNCWLTCLIVDYSKTGVHRDKIIENLNKYNIESRPVWKPMHLQPFYKDHSYEINPGRDVSKFLFDNGICLPSGSNLSLKDQNRIIDIVLSLFSFNY